MTEERGVCRARHNIEPIQAEHTAAPTEPTPEEFLANLAAGGGVTDIVNQRGWETGGSAAGPICGGRGAQLRGTGAYVNWVRDILYSVSDRHGQCVAALALPALRFLEDR
jgi:hypothetical protein